MKTKQNVDSAKSQLTNIEKKKLTPNGFLTISLLYA